MVWKGRCTGPGRAGLGSAFSLGEVFSFILFSLSLSFFDY